MREQLTFLAGHPDLYAAQGDDVRVAITDGRIAIGSLGVRGFASAAWPDVESLTPMIAAPVADDDSPSNSTAQVAPCFRP